MSEYNMIDGYDPFYTGEPIEQLKPYIVYVKPDEQNRIAAVNSSAFLPDPDGWMEIDSGFGDKYHHAQGNYFPLPIYDERGIMRYKLEDGVPVERNAEEMEADLPAEEEQPEPPVDDKEARIAALEEAMRAIQEGIASV